MFLLSVKDGKFEKISLEALDSPIIIVLLHKVQFVEKSQPRSNSKKDNPCLIAFVWIGLSSRVPVLVTLMVLKEGGIESEMVWIFCFFLREIDE